MVALHLDFLDILIFSVSAIKVLMKEKRVRWCKRRFKKWKLIVTQPRFIHAERGFLLFVSKEPEVLCQNRMIPSNGCLLTPLNTETYKRFNKKGQVGYTAFPDGVWVL